MKCKGDVDTVSIWVPLVALHTRRYLFSCHVLSRTLHLWRFSGATHSHFEMFHDKHCLLQKPQKKKSRKSNLEKEVARKWDPFFLSRRAQTRRGGWSGAPSDWEIAPTGSSRKTVFSNIATVCQKGPIILLFIKTDHTLSFGESRLCIVTSWGFSLFPYATILPVDSSIHTRSGASPENTVFVCRSRPFKCA